MGDLQPLETALVWSLAIRIGCRNQSPPKGDPKKGDPKKGDPKKGDPGKNGPVEVAQK